MFFRSPFPRSTQKRRPDIPLDGVLRNVIAFISSGFIGPECSVFTAFLLGANHSNMDDYRPVPGAGAFCVVRDLHSNMDDYRHRVCPKRTAGGNDLHSNMDEYRPRRDFDRRLRLAHLHSNMDDYRPEFQKLRFHVSTKFTFQYGRL